jgi:hypothetical protein
MRVVHGNGTALHGMFIVPVHLEILVQQVLKVLLVQLVTMEPMVTLVQLVHKETLVTTVLMVLME